MVVKVTPQIQSGTQRIYMVSPETLNLIDQCRLSNGRIRTENARFYHKGQVFTVVVQETQYVISGNRALTRAQVATNEAPLMAAEGIL